MTASPLFEFALLSFISMFTMVNPIGVVPVFTAMTAKLSPQESHRVARKATFTSLIILLAFALTGQWIFRFFSISVESTGGGRRDLFLHGLRNAASPPYTDPVRR